MIRIEMHGLDDWIKLIKNLNDPKKARKFQHDAILWMKREAKRLCPVDTGHMRDTIYMRRINDNQYELGVTAHYAAWNEWGWFGIPDIGSEEAPNFYKGGYRPFMRPAIYRGLKRLPKLFDEIYDIL